MPRVVSEMSGSTPATSMPKSEPCRWKDSSQGGNLRRKLGRDEVEGGPTRGGQTFRLSCLTMWRRPSLISGRTMWTEKVCRLPVATTRRAGVALMCTFSSKTSVIKRLCRTPEAVW